MSKWLKEQWRDISGNVKFWILTFIGGGVVTGALALTHGLALWQRIALAISFLLILCWAIVSTWFATRSDTEDDEGDTTARKASLKLQSTTLDVTSDPQITYKAKLRAVFTNDSNATVHVFPPSWITGPEDVAVQYPMGWKYRIEKTKGSWNAKEESARWNTQELTEIQLPSEMSFSVYVGLDQSVPHNELEKRRGTKRLGTLVLPVDRDGQLHKIEERV